MIYTFLTWIWIGVSSFIMGYGVVCLLSKIVKRPIPCFDIIFMFGMGVVTVYAQIFSLVYKVGCLANVILLIFCLCIGGYYRKNISTYLRKEVCKNHLNKRKWMWFPLAFFIVIILLLTSSAIRHYDTTLYHAQTIRWIEEYGVVKGLGNLHNRFAYNSSFFCLQALFGMKFLFGQSMHSVNGFIACFFVVYAWTSIKYFKEKKIFVSDFLRLCMIVYLELESTYKCISSPESDFFAIGLFFYIIIKMLSFIEDNEQDTFPYALLAILGVFAVSLKLSVAMIVLVALIPAYKLIKNKAWKEIAIYVIGGIAFILPFLIRNVIISGYLIYPYPELDLFNVDWKMPEYTLLFDRNEIKVWGWGLNNINLYKTPMTEWFPVWYNGQSNLSQVLFVINIILIPVLLGISLYEVTKQRREYFWIVITITANLLLWFVGAPLSRYGMPFMCILPFYFIGKITVNGIKKQAYKKMVYGGLLLCILFNTYPMCVYTIEQIKEIDVLQAADYPENICNEYSLDGERIYVQAEGDQSGYDSFPTTPYKQRLEVIELRGESLRDGFRIKPQYKSAFISPYGYIAENNIFIE